MSTYISGPAAGIGLATFSGDDLLDVWYPRPTLGADPDDVEGLESAIGTDTIRGTRTATLVTRIADLAAAPVDAADVYLRLHLLSHRLVQPRTINLDGCGSPTPTACVSALTWPLAPQ